MKKIIIIITVIVFYGCGDVFVPYTLNIDNASRDTIKIVFFEKSPYAKINPDFLLFFPKQKKLLYGAEGHPVENGCDYTGILEEECKVYTSSGKTLRKEIWNVNNWGCKGSKKGGWEKTFVITEEDLN